MNFSSHSRNTQKYIYVLGKDFIQDVRKVGPTNNGTTVYPEKIDKYNFT